MTAYNSPHSSFDDGVFQILLVRGNVSRYRLARILIGLETGSHVDMPGVEWIKCSAYRLEPTDNTAQSINVIDGEPVEEGRIQGTGVLHYTAAAAAAVSVGME